MAIKTASGSDLRNSLSSGLVLLNTTSFSGVASVSLPAATFNATYDNYLTILKISAATSDGYVSFKLRASGVDASSGYYTAQLGLNSSAGSNNITSSNVTTGIIVLEIDTGSSAKPTFVKMEIYNPFKAEPTNATLINASSSPSGTPQSQTGMGLHTTSTSYDAGTFIASAGNISGSISVYGFNV